MNSSRYSIALDFLRPCPIHDNVHTKKFRRQVNCFARQQSKSNFRLDTHRYRHNQLIPKTEFPFYCQRQCLFRRHRHKFGFYRVGESLRLIVFLAIWVDLKWPRHCGVPTYIYIVFKKEKLKIYFCMHLHIISNSNI